MRLDHLLSKEKEESFEARYFIGNFKIPREKFIVYFSMYFLFKYIEFESEAHKRWKNLMENSKIWAHSSDG